jgi:hypothetical protein
MSESFRMDWSTLEILSLKSGDEMGRSPYLTESANASIALILGHNAPPAAPLQDRMLSKVNRTGETYDQTDLSLQAVA